MPSDDTDATWSPRALARDVLYCALIAVVLTALFGPALSSGPGGYLVLLAINFFISLAIGMTINVLFRYLLPAIRDHLRGRAATFAAQTLLMIAGVFGGGEIAVRLLSATLGFDAADMRLSVFRIGLVVAAVVTAVTLSMDRLRERARAVELREEQTRQQALRAQLTALQSRTRPHFLFNSLNTISGLIEEDPVAAESVLQRLSEVFRYALEQSQASWVRLGDEVAAVSDYLEVESIRFGDRLDVDVDVDDAARSLWIPPLVLHPLVENAILHAVAPRREGGRIEVRARVGDGTVELRVTDDGPGPGRSAHRGSGTALRDLRERLRLIYGGSAELDTHPGEPGGTVARLTLPVRAGDGA